MYASHVNPETSRADGTLQTMGCRSSFGSLQSHQSPSSAVASPSYSISSNEAFEVDHYLSLALRSSQNRITRSHRLSDYLVTTTYRASALLNQRLEASQPREISDTLLRRRKLLPPLSISTWMTIPSLLQSVSVRTLMFAPSLFEVATRATAPHCCWRSKAVERVSMKIYALTSASSVRDRLQFSQSPLNRKLGKIIAFIHNATNELLAISSQALVRIRSEQYLYIILFLVTGCHAISLFDKW